MTNLQTPRPNWGLLPENITATLRRREWQNLRNLKARLKEEKPFPIEINLKPPRGNSVLEDMNHFQAFVAAWKAAPSPTDVRWERRRYRHISEQEVPVKLIIKDITSLARILGTEEANQLADWQAKINFVLSSLPTQKELSDVLIEHLKALSQYQKNDLELLVNLIPQLKKGMGNGCYLRALPVVTVDTKFIETNVRLVEALADVITDGTVKPMGLLAWLDCKEKPKDWLLVRPLCNESRTALGGLPLLRLSTETLLDYELPASHILVTENEQSCLALPSVANTISVSGGGKNVSWMGAAWLSSKRVAYWGDIDSEGFTILSDVRSKLGSVVPLMMDEATVIAFQERIVVEPDSVAYEPPALSQEELILFRNLRSGKYGNARLEQERIPPDYVENAIKRWVDQ